jgi:L-iditol 2-dehydrogenase
VVVGEDGASVLRPVLLRAPADGELLLAVRVSGLCGTDLWKLANGGAAAGSVLGHEIVGTVVEAGAGAAIAVGERVVVPHHVACGVCALCRRGSETMCAVFRQNLLEPGGFSDLVLVHERAARLAARVVPPQLDDPAAVFLEPAACVLRGIDRSGLLLAPPPRAAAVLGGGSMGLLHLLVLRALDPALQVVVSDPLPERRRLAAALGAARTVDPRTESVADAGRAVSSGLGVDAVFDCVGGTAALADGVATLRAGGTAVLFAHARAGETAGTDLNAFFKHEQRVIGTYSGGLSEQERIFELLVSRRLDPSPLVTHRLPLARFDEGVALCRSLAALKVLFVADAAGSAA